MANFAGTCTSDNKGLLLLLSLRLSVMKFLNNMMYLQKFYLDNGALHLAELLAFLGILVSILSVVLSC